jgi:hypothetical protein
MEDAPMRVPFVLRLRSLSRWVPFPLGLALLLVLTASTDVHARITRIVINRTESPTLGGASFGSVGQFEKLVGTAYGEVDPHHPLNAIIQDIELAPQNARGMVEYSTDIHIIKPIDMTKGNRTLLYSVVNRGNGGIPFNIGVLGGNDPTAAGDGFLQERGVTLVKSGWQPDVLPGNARMTMSVPIARNPDGTPITGLVRSEFMVSAPTNTLNLSSGRFTGLTHASYPTVSNDNTTPLPDGFLPTLTVRSDEPDPRIAVSNSLWAFGSCPDGVNVTSSATQICLFGSGFQPGQIYELLYRARDPLVLGLGYAGMRDLIAFFKHARQDDLALPILSGSRTRKCLPSMAIPERTRTARARRRQMSLRSPRSSPGPRRAVGTCAPSFTWDSTKMRTAGSCSRGPSRS